MKAMNAGAGSSKPLQSETKSLESPELALNLIAATLQGLLDSPGIDVMRIRWTLQHTALPIIHRSRNRGDRDLHDAWLVLLSLSRTAAMKSKRILEPKCEVSRCKSFSSEDI
jgi:hypothetical protein